MKLKLLDINNFIEQNNIMEVTSPKLYEGSRRESFNTNGLLSESIFGRVGSNERKTTFGYITLKTYFIHPEAYKILTSLNTDLTKLILGKENYVINENGTITQDDDNGSSGTFFFVQNFDKFDFAELGKKKKSESDYIIKNKDKVLVDKYLVVPAGIRDVQVQEKTKKTIVQYAEITELYIKLLRQVKALPDQMDETLLDVIGPTFDSIQRTLNDINSWIKSQLKGKQGLIRGGMMKKVVDYAARMVIVPDKELELGYVGIPWNIVLKLFEPFVIHEIFYNEDDEGLDLIQDFLKTEDDPDTNDIRRFISTVNDNPSIIKGKLYDHCFNLAEKVVDGKSVVYKRDPVTNRDSMIGADIEVKETGYVLKVNSLDLCRNDGDFDGDTATVFPVFSDEAIKQSKEKMNPKYSKSAWVSGEGTGRSVYDIKQDAAMQIYAATKK